jgi:choline dehydrogenase-like flavoprotein
LAARLSQDPATSVLLIEAGPDHTSAETPGGIRGLNFSAPQKVPGRIWPDLAAVRAVGQRPAPYLRGRGVGGSSAVNALIAMRGTPDDYDHWANDLDCDGWGWDTMLAAFLRVEDDAEYGGDGIHGRGGPLPVTREPPCARAPLDAAISHAVVQFGYPVCDDYHAPGASGLSRLAFNVREGRRWSTNDAYLEPARFRPNLTVRGSTLVDRVALEGVRAVGVVTADGDEIEADHVIVAAGAIHSPAILLRSGLGPDSGLPVGSNLIEHPLITIVVALDEPARPVSTNAVMAKSVLRYTSGLAEAGTNDMQVLWMSPFAAASRSLGVGLVFPAVTRVFSRGELRLQSPDPHDDPIIEFRMLSDERDLIRLRDGVRRALDILDHPAVRAIATRSDETLPDRSDADALDAWIRATVTDYKHPVGTCRMGSAADPAAVVDTHCRVKGIDHLWVCDASIMPDLPRANTHLTTVAIAEHTAARLVHR